MVFHMKAKTTLTIDQQLMRRVKERAAREGVTMSALVEQALRRELNEANGKPKRQKLVKIRQFDMGPFPVDISDRNALHDFLDAND